MYVLINPDIDIGGVLRYPQHGPHGVKPIAEATSLSAGLAFSMGITSRLVSMMMLVLWVAGPTIYDLTCARLR
jgi:hypothetical protein